MRPVDDKDLIYEGIATVDWLSLFCRLRRLFDDKDLIYEGIATRLRRLFAIIYCDDKDLIYEGIATIRALNRYFCLALTTKT